MVKKRAKKKKNLLISTFLKSFVKVLDAATKKKSVSDKIEASKSTIIFHQPVPSVSSDLKEQKSSDNKEFKIEKYSTKHFEIKMLIIKLTVKINKTTEVDEFFDSYDALLDILNQMIFKDVSNDILTKDPYDEWIKLKEMREDETNRFIERAFESLFDIAKDYVMLERAEKRIDELYSEIDSYSRNLTGRNALYLMQMEKKCKSEIQKIFEYKSARSKTFDDNNTINNKTDDETNERTHYKQYDFDKINDGFEFEYYIASLLKENDYSDVEVTKKSGDFGIDVLAKKDGVKYAIQCKLYSQPVGNKAVQEARAGKDYYNCHVAVVATNNTFTSNAKELAEKTGVILWDRAKILSMEKKLIYDSYDDSIAREKLYRESIDVVEMAGFASVSLLQHSLKIGLLQAESLLEELEGNRIIGSANGSFNHPVLNNDTD